MSAMQKLVQVTDEEKRAIFKHYDISEKDFEEKIDSLVEWYKKTGLPDKDELRHKVRISLINNKMSTERAKKSVKAYYEVRTRYRGFFEDLVPGTEFYDQGRKYMKSIVLPKLTPDLCRIHITKFTDPGGDAPNGFIYEVTSFMQAELRIKCEHELFLSHILIFDLSDYGLKHMLKYTPTINTQLVNIMLALNLRIQNIHFVNLSPVMDKIMMLLKSVLPTKFYNRLVIHDTFDTLHEYIPKEYLPLDYGGTLPSILEIHDEWIKLIEEEKEYFQRLSEIKHEIAAEGKTEYEIIGTGVDGSFKKLTID